MNEKDNIQILDQRTMPFTMVDNSILDSMSFDKPIDKLLYMCICRFSHMNQIYPSIQTLMLMCGVSSKNTLKAGLKRLEDLGLIKVQDRGRRNDGQYNTHCYVLLEVPEHIKNNSAFDNDKKEEKKKVIKIARLEKAVKTNHNKHVKGGRSKFDPGENDQKGVGQNLTEGRSKFDRSRSKFDPNKKESIKKESTNKNLDRVSIYESEIEKIDLPDRIKSVLKNKIDRLMLHKIKLMDVELSYKENEGILNMVEYASVLSDVLEAKKYNYGFKKYMGGSVIRFLENRQKKVQAAGQPNKSGRKEIEPDWINKVDNEEPPAEISPEIAERVRKLQAELVK